MAFGCAIPVSASYRMPNCRMRGVPAMDVMLPNVDDVKFTSGEFQLTVLNRLNASIRNATRPVAPSDTTLDSDASTVQNPALARRCGEVPTCPAPAIERIRVQPAVRRPVAMRIGEDLVDPLIQNPGAGAIQPRHVDRAPERALTIPEILQSEAHHRSAGVTNRGVSAATVKLPRCVRSCRTRLGRRQDHRVRIAAPEQKGAHRLAGGVAVAARYGVGPVEAHAGRGTTLKRQLQPAIVLCAEVGVKVQRSAVPRLDSRPTTRVRAAGSDSGACCKSRMTLRRACKDRAQGRRLDSCELVPQAVGMASPR